MSEQISNVLAERYASTEVCAIWSATGRVRLEREYWIAVMKAQKSLGMDIPDEAIAAYESVIDEIDHDDLMVRERVTRHDVKARIEQFCERAGHQHIHKGLTSRDLTENVEQLQVFKSLKVIHAKCVATLHQLALRASEWRDLPISGRTHNVIAQLTTLGKRMSMVGEELLGATGQLEHIIATYPIRGLKGAVGTQVDQVSLFEGDLEKVAALEQNVLAELGLPERLDNVGQVYPRSLDMRVVNALTELASGPGNMAITLRLMAGHELASEGFAPGQTGSSAMPHKMNSRSCERVNGFHTLLKGYAAMAAGLAGDQWNEGDVSCSVVRRVMLPDAFFAMDGLLETFLTILKQMDAYPAVIQREIESTLPFLCSTSFLMAAVKQGVGREAAHKAIKQHALATVADLRSGQIERNDLLQRLASDETLGLSLEELQALLAEARTTGSGQAPAQVDAFVAAVAELSARYPGAADYQPGSIL